MAGYVYCMKNDHSYYKRYMKIGYTERTPHIRALELSEKWHCKFEVLWDIDVYHPQRAESFLHELFLSVRFEHEFFRVDPDRVKELAERYFDENWRETEGKEILTPDLSDLAELDGEGFLLERDSGFNELEDEDT